MKRCAQPAELEVTRQMVDMRGLASNTCSSTAHAAIAALLCALLSVGTPAFAATSSAAKSALADSAGEGLDAGEIAARAAASAVAGDSAAQNSDFAAGGYDAVVRDLLLRIESIEKEHGHVARELEAPLFELGKLYVSADQCRNAIPILRQAIALSQRLDGVMNPRQLRAMARTYRLETQYEQEALRGRALDAEGQRTLERAARIARASTSDGDTTLRIETLLELADWYQMDGAVRDAVKVYKEAWQAAVDAGRSGAELLGEPQPILYRAALGVALRRPPPDREKLKHYWIDFEFAVTRFGEVNAVVAKNATAPRDLQLGIAENLKRTHYRPRFVDGDAVDTAGVRIRQGVWVSK